MKNTKMDLLELFQNKSIDILYILDIEIDDLNVDLALIVASQYGLEDIVEMLLKHGASVNAKNYKHETPLMLSSEFGHIAIVKLLLNSGADINKKNIWKGNALTYAIENSQKDIVKLLLSKGAKIDAELLLAIKKMGLDYFDRLKNAIEALSDKKILFWKQNFDKEMHKAKEVLWKTRLKIINYNWFS